MKYIWDLSVGLYVGSYTLAEAGPFGHEDKISIRKI